MKIDKEALLIAIKGYAETHLPESLTPIPESLGSELLSWMSDQDDLRDALDKAEGLAHLFGDLAAEIDVDLEQTEGNL